MRNAISLIRGGLKMKRFHHLRHPAVANQFYPGSPELLQEEVQRCLARKQSVPNGGRVRALIVPHAGYQYSGPTAGKAYALLAGARHIRRVLVIAPSHHVAFQGACVGDYDGYSTPLGEISVDTVACKELLQCSSMVSVRREAQEPEHALEVQLPFIQEVLPEATLIPLVCGDLDQERIRELSACLAKLFWREDTLWVISTDFTHFGHAFGYVPFERDIPRNLAELDQGAIDTILNLDLAAFWDYLAQTGATICGRLPIALLLGTLANRKQECLVELVDYTSSGKLTQDYSHCVSYASIAVRDRADGHPVDLDACEALAENDKINLLKLAREAIRTHLDGNRLPEPEPELGSPALQAEWATFVTLHLNGNLRGCIGSLDATEPLVQNVLNNARNAAFRDPRFPRLTPEELDETIIEISVLTPPRPIKSLDEVVLGKHGIILEKDFYRSVFLPQVAPEQGWDLETTLNHLALKAGLEVNGWRRGASFAVFEAIVFSEKDHPKAEMQ
jgi:AmmeMemoRadiSam system protein B/AmmeMemoRadiSam system protein A